MRARRRASPLNSRLGPALLSVVLVAACGTTVGPAALRASGQSDVGGLAATSGTVTVGTSPAAVASSGPGSVPGIASGPGPVTTPTVGLPGQAVGVTPASAGGPVEVGFLVAKDLGAAIASLGYTGLSTGNGASQADTGALLINRGGGLGGHPVKPVVVQLDVTQNYDTQMQAACSTFFEDHHVVGVVSLFAEPIVMQCATAHGTPFVDAGPGTMPGTMLAQYPLTTLLSSPRLERAVAALVSALGTAGYFRPGSDAKPVKVGLVYTDDLNFAQAPALVAGDLHSAGLTLVAQAAIPYVAQEADAASAASAAASAVLRFASAGINRVIAVDSGGSAATYFSIAASAEGYAPRLGVSSLSEPALLHSVLSTHQLAGAVGVGWSPVEDVALSAQPPPGPSQAACLTAMSHAGEDIGVAATRLFAVEVCDASDLLAAAWRGASTLDAASYLAGLAAVGASYQAVSTLGTDFTSRRDGPSVMRPLAFETACACFAYDGGPSLLP